jgi:hypothetical protein
MRIGMTKGPEERSTAAEVARGMNIIYIVGSETQKDSVFAEAVEIANNYLGNGQPGQVSAFVAPPGDPNAELMVATMPLGRKRLRFRLPRLPATAWTPGRKRFRSCPTQTQLASEFHANFI